MRLSWIWTLMLSCAVFPYAQTVNLTGIVTDSANNSPLNGVIVVLETLGYLDTTGSDGKYSLKSPPVPIVPGKSINATAARPNINSGFLFFDLPQKEKVTAAMYSPAGRALGTIIDQELAPGTYRAALPSIQKSAGIYYIKVVFGNSQEIVKFLSVNEQQGQNRSVNRSQRLDKKLATIVDTLFFEKTGYEPKILPITSFEGAMNITMTATPNVVDIDGNVYHTVTIGTQDWMVENLKTTKYNDGSAIPLVTDGASWSTSSVPGYCWHNNDSTYKNSYGALYNWYTVNTGKLAPTGWHVPSDSEWTVLTTYFGPVGWAGGALKSRGATYWQSPNTGATNISGFSALPGGDRNDYHDNIDPPQTYGTFGDIGHYGYWWSSTKAGASSSWFRSLGSDYAGVISSSFSLQYGFSVRCLRD
jgi:uncharacterized protein (TIGR02145 family)